MLRNKIFIILRAIIFLPHLLLVFFSPQKELIKEVNRNYENTQHWNLDAEYLEPLREFLTNYLK